MSHLKTAIIAFLAVATFGMAALGQDQSKPARIGVVMSGNAAGSKDFLEGLRQGLSEAGLIEGRHVLLDVRYALGRMDQVGAIATDLANSNTGIIFTGGDQASSAAQRVTKTIPIVAVTCDALAAGLVKNLARPGGNLTGVTCINSDLSGKRVELLREIIPSISKIGVTLDSNDKRMLAEFTEADHAASVKGIKTRKIEITRLDQLEAAFTSAAQNEVNGIVVVFDSMLLANRTKVAEIAIANHLPTIFNFRQFSDAGGLMSFGPNLRDMYRQSARHVLKILKGEAPGDIPMEQPTRFELVINLKTAKALGITIPEPLLVRADEVIE